MIYIILIFSLAITFKSILLSEFYNNFLIFSLYPLELASLSFNNNFSDIVIKWVINGWFRQDNEIEYINIIQEFNNYAILISWCSTYFLFNIYVFLRYRKKINRYLFISHQLKFIIINYLSLILWSLNILLNYDNINIFTIILINVYLFNFIAFWFPGILFYLIYGDKMYIYRKKYEFLIKNYNPKYKYFMIILHLLKLFTFVYMIIYIYYSDKSDYIIVLYNIINIIIYVKTKDIFIYKKFNIYLIILHSISLLLVICSILDSYFKYSKFIKYSILFVNIILLIYFNYQRRFVINKYYQNRVNQITNNINLNIDI